ncbi:LOW QUALITY PROTEIN: dynein intermediate chain 3, ciliary-like [Apis dorsata]|uniref:LOW QUALITY PROTEIN: dynein intermediate chain 3, ciliary-like n=1 Tax=Apis dorsata TaxID=7462 RepID=UPI001293B19C|nr:LOW QUALITY PROTEIN: dynein intermediate chain 3, ciliary-like [Apis dorsata]
MEDIVLGFWRKLAVSPNRERRSMGLINSDRRNENLENPRSVAMEIRKVYVKTRAEFGKQCIFSIREPTMDAEISPKPSEMSAFILKSERDVEVQHSAQFALHQIQTDVKMSKNTGMFHFEGGWPKDINPRDEETTSRFRRRVEKDDNWAPKLLPMFEVMEHAILQNGTVNIHQHYFDDMIPTPLAQTYSFRTVNVYRDPDIPRRPVTNISWSADTSNRLAVSYCFLTYGRDVDYSKTVYIWHVENPTEPYMGLEPFSPCVCCEYSPRDLSILASSHISGQVNSWDTRTGNKPVQSSHPRYSHRDIANKVKWIPSKTNTEFFSTSYDGCAMWWDTRFLKQPTEVLILDLEDPNHPQINRAIGISSVNYLAMVGTKFMFGLDNGIIISGSRKARTSAEKLAVRFDAHTELVKAVDRSTFTPSLFLSVGDWRVRIWMEDTREEGLISARFQVHPTDGCWSKTRSSCFYVTTDDGKMIVYDILQSIRNPIFELQLSHNKLNCIVPSEEEPVVAIGSYTGKVYLVEPGEFFTTFSRRDRTFFSEFLERCSKLTKGVDIRLKEIKLMLAVREELEEEEKKKLKERVKKKERDTRITQEKNAKMIKDREKLVKDRKKVRDFDTPEIIEAERKYFEIVEKEMERYADDDPDIIPFAVSMQVKKTDKRRKPSEPVIQVTEKPEILKREILKTRREKPIKKTIKKKPVSIAKVPSKITDVLIKKELEKIIPEKHEKKVEKVKPKTMKLKLPDPCKDVICKPKVCCMKRGVRVRRKKKVKKEETEAAKWKRKREKLIIMKIQAPPTEFKEDVRRAKEEIKEAQSKKKYPKIYEKKRKLSLEIIKKEEEEVDEEEVYEEISEKILTKIKKKVKQAARHPCFPSIGKTAEELYEDIIGVPFPEIVEKAISEDSIVEYLRAKKRIYPRISEFFGNTN